VVPSSEHTKSDAFLAAGAIAKEDLDEVDAWLTKRSRGPPRHGKDVCPI
jgi:hypothetical protein